MRLRGELPGLEGSVAGEFPILGRWVFLNHAGVAPIALRTRRALEKYAREAAEDAYLTGKWYKQAEIVRRNAARLINAEPEEIAFVKNTSEGIAFVANGLEWRPGDEVIGTGVAYPTMVYPWMDLERRLGVRHVVVPERREDGTGRFEVGDILGAVTGRTRMIALSHIEYASGFRHDVAAIGKFCREKGILFCVDGIQACGHVPVDVKGMGIDFLSADGHKWLLGPEGAGIFYCRKELLGELRPEVGWMNVENALDFGKYDLTLRGDARRFECGTYNIPGILGMGASLELLLEVGMETVTGRILGLSDLLVEELERRGWRVFSSRREGEKSGIVSFGRPGVDAAKTAAELEKKGIVVAVREGRLRVSAHFYNTEEQVGRVVEALGGE